MKERKVNRIQLIEGLRRVRDSNAGGAIWLAQKLGKSSSTIYSWSKSTEKGKGRLPSISDLRIIAIIDAPLTGKTTEEAFKWWCETVGYGPEEIVANVGLGTDNSRHPGRTVLNDLVNNSMELIRENVLGDQWLPWAISCRVSQLAADQARDAWLHEEPGGDVSFFWTCVSDQEVIVRLEEKDLIEFFKTLLMEDTRTVGGHTISGHVFLNDHSDQLDDIKVALKSLRKELGLEGRDCWRIRLFIHDAHSDRSNRVVGPPYLGDFWVYSAPGNTLAHLVIRVANLRERILRMPEKEIRQYEVLRERLIKECSLWSFAVVQLDSSETLHDYMKNHCLTLDKVRGRWERKECWKAIEDDTDSPTNSKVNLLWG